MFLQQERGSTTHPRCDCWLGFKLRGTALGVAFTAPAKSSHSRGPTRASGVSAVSRRLGANVGLWC